MEWFGVPRSRRLVELCVRFSLVGASAAFGMAQAQTLVPGHTPGEFSVSPSGAATYSIPIQVPPGVAGLVPSLSLNYSSQGGNGIAGLGWSLDGESSITRCPRTLATDGVQGRVNHDGNDRFCLDGQRLMVVSGGYGAAGSEYRTEFDQFSKVVANGAAAGNAANGPESFTVYTKDGRILQYGNTAESRMEAQGKAVVAAWVVRSISDVKGNTIIFNYTEDNANGDWRLGSLGYAGRSVHFFYEVRPDIYRGYQAGSTTATVARLKQVETRIGTAVVQRTNLSYDASSNLYSSRLASVQLCDKDNKCLAPTTFGWGSVGPDAYTGAIYASHSGGKTNHHTADFDGDGRSDMTTYSGSGKWNTCLSTGTGFNCSLWPGHAAGVGGSVFGDFNGDGRTDIAGWTSVGSSWVVCYSTGSGFPCVGATIHPGGPGRNVSGDFNGDGRTDMAYYTGSGGIWKMCLSTGSGFSCVNWASHGGGHANNLTADFNGDGLDDMAGYTGANGNWHVCLSNGAGFNCSYMTSHTGGMSKTKLGDFNGDGLTDMAGFLGTPGSGVAPWKICLSTGTNFTCSDWTAHNAGLLGAVGDYNGDGRTDLAAYNGSLGQWRMCLSTGTNFNCSMWSGAAHNDAQGDYNGDGIDDFAAYTGSGGNWHFSYSLKKERPLIQSITRGAVATGIEYQGMSAPGQLVYTKENSSTYPYRDIQSPMWLVRRTTVSNGVGSVNATRYHYGGMRAELANAAGRGRGNQGFRWYRLFEEPTQTELHFWHAQDWPYTGQTIKSRVRVVGAAAADEAIKLTDTQYGCFQTMGTSPTAGCPAGVPGLIYLVWPVVATEKSWDYNGVALPEVQTHRAYSGTNLTDGSVKQLGDVTVLRVDVLQAGVLKHRKRTVNEYHPAKTTGTDWQIGRLKKATATSTQY